MLKLITRRRKSIAVTLIMVVAILMLVLSSGVGSALSLTAPTPLPTASGVWGKYLGQTCDPAVVQACVSACRNSRWPCIESACYWGCSYLRPATPTPVPFMFQ
jgi:hypothetical protein